MENNIRIRDAGNSVIYMKLETGNLTRIVQDTVHSSKQNWKGATQHEKLEYKNSLQTKLNNIKLNSAGMY